MQGDGGAITITPTDGDINIAPDGTISSVVNGVGNQLGKLKVVDFADDAQLDQAGRQSLFHRPDAHRARRWSISGRARWKPPTSSR